jgi:hypothetical protein
MRELIVLGIVGEAVADRGSRALHLPREPRIWRRLNAHTGKVIRSDACMRRLRKHEETRRKQMPESHVPIRARSLAELGAPC